jgi:hypothetical protein
VLQYDWSLVSYIGHYAVPCVWCEARRRARAQAVESWRARVKHQASEAAKAELKLISCIIIQGRTNRHRLVLPGSLDA